MATEDVWKLKIKVKTQDDIMVLTNAITALLEHKDEISKIITEDGSDLGDDVQAISDYIDWKVN